MYVSKYYTCEEIDQRLLQGYYDDAMAYGFEGTLREFWAFILSISNKIDKKEGWDLSENNFSDELKAKLDGIEEHANYITRVSQLENDLDYQTEEQVEKYISDLVDGADDALDTLKELAEALNNDPNFATNITNRLTELRTQLEAEVTRAKEKEGELAGQIKVVNDNLVNSVNNLNAAIAKVVSDINVQLQAINSRIQKTEEKVNALEIETGRNLAEAKEYAKDLVDTEAEARRTADEKINEAIHQVQLDHIQDISDLNNKVLTEASERANADNVLESKLNTEISDRKTADQELESKINAEASTRTAQDEVLHQQIVKEIADRQTADNGLQQNIDQEAQNRQNADTVLQNNIDNEKETRIAQDAILDHKIEDIKAQATSDKESLLEKLNEEKEARITADQDLEDRKVDKREGYSLTKNDFTDILKAKLDGIEERANYITKVSELLNDAGYQTEADLNAAIEKIIGEAPEVLDTLQEIADALGNDPNFATTITKKLAAITEQLNQEIADRAAADTTLQANIDKEIADRQAADTALETSLREYIDGEIEDITGDNANVISLLNKEIQDRKDADAALQAAITKEETDRKAVDSQLGTRITTNATRIQELALSIQDAVNTAKNELQGKIDALQVEVNTNKDNIQRNTDRLNDQISKEADDYTELKGLINEEVNNRITGDTTLKAQADKLNIDLNTEVSKREAGDTILQQNIDKEISGRTAADTLLDTKFTNLINTESTARANEDEKINTKISQEIADRQAADTALSDRINTLNQSVTDSLADLSETVVNNTTAIQTEVDRAKAAEQAIKDSLNTLAENHKDDLVGISKDIHDEAQARLLEDTKLQNAIDSERVARENEDTLLSNKITQEVSDRTTAIDQLKESKVDKIDGKELSSNDFTDILKAKLDNIEEFANYITKVSELQNDSNYQNAEQVEAAIQRIIGTAPGVLDTLQEIADALGNDPNFATTITEKLTKLNERLVKETQDRMEADTEMEGKFTTLSDTLNSTVSDLRTFVTDTRTELLTKAQAQDALISQNTANIQRNLELIQGIQQSQSTGYLEVKELLNTEIEARKSEDIRIEAKVDKNTQDLNTERNERIEADKVLQDNIDAEEAARIAADEALGARIDKEIQDRKDADTALDNKFTNITNDHETRLQAEEATSDSLPLTVVTEIDPELVVNSEVIEVNFKSSVKEEGNLYSDPMARKFAIPAATEEKAGLHSAADKKAFDSLPDTIVTSVYLAAASAEGADVSGIIDDIRPKTKIAGVDVYNSNLFLNHLTREFDQEQGRYIDKGHGVNLPLASDMGTDGLMSALDKIRIDSLPDTIVTGESATSDSDKVTVTLDRVTLDSEEPRSYKEDDTTFDLPVASGTQAGTMSAKDKTELDRIVDTNFDFEETSYNGTQVTINGTSLEVETGEELPKMTTIKSATDTEAGVMSAADKKLFDTLPDIVVRDFGFSATDSAVFQNVNREIISEEDKVYVFDDVQHKQLPTASNVQAGVMTAADKVKLDETLPNQIAQEVQDRKDAIEALKNSSDEALAALEAKHDAFVATKGQPNGFASLDSNGLVPSSQLPSYVDDVINVYATYEVSETGGLSNINLYSDAAHANPITGETGKIYVNVTDGEPPYQFRWSGTQFVDSNTSSLILGEVTGTAYDGAKGKKTTDTVNSLPNLIVTRLERVEQDEQGVNIVFNASSKNTDTNLYNTPSPLTIPLNKASNTSNGVMSAADKKLFDSLPSPIMTGATCTQTTDSVTINLARVSKSTEGVYSTNNDAFNLPVVSGTQAGIMTSAMFTKLNSGLNTDIANALAEAKTYTDNAKSALTKLISDETSARQAADTTIQNNLDTHTGNTSNPHKVTKAQVGLGNVSNLAPADMPVSTAQATAIADAKAAGTNAKTALDTHANRKDNPHNVTRAQLGLATTDQVVFAKTTAASGFWKESDGRLKSQVVNLSHTLDQICNIPTVHFKMNGKYQVGTIAQNLEEIEPLLVSENTIPASQVPNQSRFETLIGEDGQEYVKVKVVEYEMLSVMALEGVKLLRKEIEDLKKQLNNK